MSYLSQANELMLACAVIFATPWVLNGVCRGFFSARGLE